MERENTPRIVMEELLKKAEPVIKTAFGILAAVRFIQTKVESLTFEEQLLNRHNQLVSMGLTEEQARAALNQSIENMLAKGRNTNQEGGNYE